MPRPRDVRGSRPGWAFFVTTRRTYEEWVARVPYDGRPGIGIVFAARAYAETVIGRGADKENNRRVYWQNFGRWPVHYDTLNGYIVHFDELTPEDQLATLVRYRAAHELAGMPAPVKSKEPDPFLKKWLRDELIKARVPDFAKFDHTIRTGQTALVVDAANLGAQTQAVDELGTVTDRREASLPEANRFKLPHKPPFSRAPTFDST